MNHNYKKDFISNFIIRFDYNEINEEVLEELQGIFEDKFKFIINETKTMEVGKVIINPKTKESSIESTGVQKEFNLYNGDRKTKLKFTNEMFIYETMKYTSYDEIKLIIEEFIKIIAKNGKEDTFNRIGMRYVNNIELPYEDKKDIFNWSNYINNLLWNSKQFSDSFNIIQKITAQEFKIGELSNVVFRLQSGIPNPNKPSELVNKKFLIDLDGFTINVENFSNTLAILQEIHDNLNIIFEECITDDLRKIMDGE